MNCCEVIRNIELVGCENDSDTWSASWSRWSAIVLIARCAFWILALIRIWMKRRSMLEGSWINTTFDLSFTPHASKYSPFCRSLPLYTTFCSSTCNPVSPLSTFFTSPVISFHVTSFSHYTLLPLQLSSNQTHLHMFPLRHPILLYSLIFVCIFWINNLLKLCFLT